MVAGHTNNDTSEQDLRAGNHASRRTEPVHPSAFDDAKRVPVSADAPFDRWIAEGLKQGCLYTRLVEAYQPLLLECPCYTESPSYPVQKFTVIVNKERHLACVSCLMLIGLTDQDIELVRRGRP